MTLLIWILSAVRVLILIHSTQIKFFIDDSWILKSSLLSWSNWSFHRIVHNGGLRINLTFRVSKLQTDLGRWLRLVIRIISSFLVHVSRGAINNASLWNSVILLNSVGINSFVLLGIKGRLFWNQLIGLLLARLSLMIQISDISHSVISMGRVIVAVLLRALLASVSSLNIWILSVDRTLDVLRRTV